MNRRLEVALWFTLYKIKEVGAFLLFVAVVTGIIWGLVCTGVRVAGNPWITITMLAIGTVYVEVFILLGYGLYLALKAWLSSNLCKAVYKVNTLEFDRRQHKRRYTISRITIVVDNAEAVVKRMFWLAYQACGGATGLGLFQARDDADEEAVWNNVQTNGDYPGDGRTNEGSAYGDYVFGRMMKLGVDYEVGAAGFVNVSDAEPWTDYQGWSTKYKTYKQLADAAIEDLAE